MSNSGLTRRRFCIAAAASVFTPNMLSAASGGVRKPRVRQPNPYVTSDGKPIVAVIRGKNFASMLAKGMELLGGFKLLGNHLPVLIKPNFVFPIPYPYTTDGPSILSVIDAMEHEGFSSFAIAEWGVGHNMENERATSGFSYYGLDELAGPGRFDVIDLAWHETRTIRDPRWKALNEVNLRSIVYQAPLIINMPVLKEHTLCRFTCAIKNFVGTVNARSRRDFHGHDTPDKQNRLRPAMLGVAEIASAVNPELTIVDARQVVGEDHLDPAKGKVVNCGRVIISGDMVAADLVASEILGKKLRTYDNGDADLMLRHAAALTGAPKKLDDVKVIRARAA